MNENNIKSPGFSEFRKLLDLWDQQLIKEADESAIRSFLAANNFLLFFVYTEKIDKNKSIKRLYATDEDNRILFSRMKDPKERSKIDKMEVFTAVDLKKALKSHGGLDDQNKVTFSRGFNKETLNNIKVVDEDYVVSHLKKFIKKNPPTSKSTEEVILQDDE